MSRKTATEGRWQRTEVVTDTLREVVLVTVRDTVWEKTTETLLVNDTGDTLRRNIVSDRLTVRDRNREQLSLEHKAVTADSVEVETKDVQAVVLGAHRKDVEIGQDGSLSIKTPKGNTFLRIIKWIVVLLCVVIALMVVVKVFGRKA